MTQVPLDDPNPVLRRRREASRVHDRPQQDLRPIVLVDDSDIDVFIAARCFERCAVRNPLVVLRGGGALLADLEERRIRKLPAPALVLLDLDMPGLDGVEALERIRMQDGFGPPLRVMVMSHCEGRQDEAQASGADAFAAKPSTVEGYVRFFNDLPQHWDDVVAEGQAPRPDYETFATV